MQVSKIVPERALDRMPAEEGTHRICPEDNELGIAPPDASYIRRSLAEVFTNF